SVPSNESVTSPEQSLGADAAILREYGFVSLERTDFATDKDRLRVTLYKMTDPSAAYGAFTHLRAPTTESLNAGAFSAAFADRALIVVGNLLLDISKNPGIPETRNLGIAPLASDLKLLAAAIAPKADHRPYPSIGARVPGKGKIGTSEHYYL